MTGVRQLRAGQSLLQQALVLDQDVARRVVLLCCATLAIADSAVGTSYALSGLQAHTSYEVRVSYPGTIPADVRVRFAEKRTRGAGSRHVRNCVRRVTMQRLTSRYLAVGSCWTPRS